LPVNKNLAQGISNITAGEGLLPVNGKP